MDNQKIANLIVDYMGGSENIIEVINCMTRVRIKTKDNSLVDKRSIEKIEGVLGLVEGEELQIVMGPGKSAKIAGLISQITSSQLKHENIDDITRKNKEKVKQKQKKTAFKRFTAIVASIFVPLIPAFVGAGIIGGIASILSNLQTAGSLQSENWIQIISVLKVIQTAMYGYLNVYIGINAAKVFKATQGLGGIVGAIIYLSAMNPEDPIINIFTHEPLVAGQGGVIGVLIAVFIMSIIEKNLRKVVPDSLDVILTPTITLLVTGILTLFIIMPFAGLISTGLIGIIDKVLEIGGAFAGFILGAFFLPMVMFGLHQILTPIHVAMIENQGATYLLPLLAMAGAGQVGAAIAILIKCRKNKKLMEIVKGALPVGILGIGEPLIYAVSLPMGKTFITACIGGGIGGAVIAQIGKIGASAIGPSGIALIPLIVDNKWMGYVIGLISAYIGGFVFTYLFGIDKKYEQDNGLEMK
ncbi:MAG: PTS transporter subunit EIIC [Tissierellia bacterium]|nr:PTS transporter subunit EIIC [Tissierellia bacterium]